MPNNNTQVTNEVVALLTGQTQEHLLPLNNGQLVHRDVLQPLQALQSDAAREGFALTVASGFRSFDRQLSIWSAKTRGDRPVLSSQGEPLAVERLSDYELLMAILRWSALPGTSRHHWGTDLDVYDTAAVAEDYQLQLTPEETVAPGPFSEFHRWLDDKISSNQSHGFYRPYASDLQGVSPEPWHISYAPLADDCAEKFSFEVFQQLLSCGDIPLQAVIDEHAQYIYQQFINNCSPAPWISV